MKDDLITALYSRLKNNIDALSQIDWLDVEVYCTFCVAGRDEIYTPEEYEELNNNMHYLCKEIKVKVDSNDYRNAILMLAELSGIIRAMPETEHYREVIYQAEFDKMMSEHYRKETFVVLGDSHVNFFSGNELLAYTSIGYDMHWCKTINNIPVTALHVGPGLAYNSCKYGTTSRFLEKTEFLLDNYIKKGTKILVTLGEVDCRAHVIRQSIKQGRDYHEIIEDITGNYIRYLKMVKERGYMVGCWGPVASQSESVPIHPDDKRYPRYGTEIERNKATEYFNERMEQLCNEEGIKFITLFPMLIDENYKTCNDLYSEDGVHLGQKALPEAISLLKEIGYL